MFSRYFIFFSSLLLTLLYCSLALAGPPFPVPKTGQKSSLKTGDDGDLELGTPWPDPRFTDNNDGTVRDNLTGLIWLKNANCFGEVNIATAKSNTEALASGSCDLSDGSSAGDWQLPTVRELESLTDKGQYDPALPSGHPFSNVESDEYWSSTPFEGGSGNFWVVLFYNSNAFPASYVNALYVWPVRSGQ